MKKLKPGCKHWVIAPALGLSLAVSAHAADTRGNAATSPRSDSTVSRDVAATTRAHDLRASKLIGMEVTNRNGQDLGEIKDLVLDATNGRVQYAVLSFGGIAGIGDKLFAYPLDQFQIGRDREKLVLNVSEQKLKAAPGFDARGWPDFNTPDYRGQVDRYHGSRTTASARFIRGSELLDGDVKDRQNNDIGDIEDVVVNLQSGRVHYVAIEFDRAWNPVDRVVAVPWRKVRAEDGRSDLVFQASREQLRGAPSFERDKWPDWGRDSGFRSNVERYGQI